MGRKRGTNSKGSKFADDIIKKVWKKGKPVKGKDLNLYRQDDTGHTIYKPSYGKDSKMGWEIDHKKPLEKGGTDSLKNLRPLQSKENKKKGDQYPWKP